MSLNSYKPVNSRVLIEPINEEQKTAAGIYIPDQNTRTKLRKGKVIGSDDKNVNPGEIVFFRPGIGYDVPIDGKVYLLIRSVDIELARVENHKPIHQ